MDRCPVHQASEALGVQVRPDGIEEKKMEYLLSRTQQWSESLWLHKTYQTFGSMVLSPKLHYQDNRISSYGHNFVS
jgi:hypothetical protein